MDFWRHQQTWMELLTGRRSCRKWHRFRDEELLSAVSQCIEAAATAPSSCDRKAISTIFMQDSPLVDSLVGGVGFLRAAPYIDAFVADMTAYGDRPEAAFMPYLDGGAAVMNFLTMAAVLGLGCCWVNPSGAHDFFAPQRLISVVGVGYPAESWPSHG